MSESRRLPASWILGLATLLAVAAGALLAHHRSLLSPAPHLDEGTYLRAFDLAARGADPYDEPRFMYSPAFAVAGALLEDRVGPAGVLALLRAGSVLGLWALAWASLHRAPWPLAVQAVAAIALALSPLVERGLYAGNVSCLAAGVLVGGLALAPHHPLAAGAVLGAVNAMKPLGVPALVIAAAPERGWRPSRRAVLLAAAAAGTAGAILLFGLEWLPSMLGRAGGLPDNLGNGSVARVLWALGLPITPVVPFLAITGAGLALARWRGGDHRARVAVAASTSLLALPVVNPDSFLLAVPAQALALERAAAGLAGAWRSRRGRGRALAVAALVGAAVLGVHGAEGTSATGELPVRLQGLVTLLPLLAAAGTTVYGTGGAVATRVAGAGAAGGGAPGAPVTERAPA